MKSPRNADDLPFASELSPFDGDLEIEGDYDRVRFDGAAFADADARGSRFAECVFAGGSGFDGARLRRARLTDVWLGETRLVAVDLAESSLTDVWFSGCVLAGVQAFASVLREGDSAKFIELPKARYGLFQVDTVLHDGEQIGVSHDCGYIHNEQAFVSLASIDPAQAPVGSEVTVLWGESPNSRKPAVEPHIQVEIRATVAPAPLVSFARSSYRAA